MASAKLSFHWEKQKAPSQSRLVTLRGGLRCSRRFLKGARTNWHRTVACRRTGHCPRLVKKRKGFAFCFQGREECFCQAKRVARHEVVRGDLVFGSPTPQHNGCDRLSYHLQTRLPALRRQAAGNVRDRPAIFNGTVLLFLVALTCERCNNVCKHCNTSLTSL